MFPIQGLREAFPTVTLAREIWRVSYEGFCYSGSVSWIGVPILCSQCFCPWRRLPKVIAPGKMLPHGKASWEGSLPLTLLVRWLVLLALAVLSTNSPAVAKTEVIIAPDGRQIITVKCARNPSKCMSEARQVCKGNYQVLDSESHAGGLLADIMPGPVTWYGMAISCGKSDGAMPSFPFRGPNFRMPSMTQCNVVGGSVFCISN